VVSGPVGTSCSARLSREARRVGSVNDDRVLDVVEHRVEQADGLLELAVRSALRGLGLLARVDVDLDGHEVRHGAQRVAHRHHVDVDPIGLPRLRVIATST